MAYRVMLASGDGWRESGVIETNPDAAREWWDAKAKETGIRYRFERI